MVTPIAVRTAALYQDLVRLNLAMESPLQISHCAAIHEISFQHRSICDPFARAMTANVKRVAYGPGNTAKTIWEPGYKVWMVTDPTNNFEVLTATDVMASVFGFLVCYHRTS